MKKRLDSNINNKSHTKKNLQLYAMMAPNLLFFIVLTVYPVIWALRYVFFEFDGTSKAMFIGMDNFVRLFTRDDIFWGSVVNTFVYASGKIIIVIPLAFLVAVMLNQKRRGNGFIQAIVFSPTIMSSAVMAMVFYLLFNVYNGDVNKNLIFSGIIKQPVNWLGAGLAMTTVIIVAVWGGLGNYMVYFLAGLQGISTEIYESVDIDGASKFQKMIYITLPMLGPVLKIILMLAIVASFQDIQSIMVMTEGGPFGKTNVMFLYIYQLYFPISAGQPINPEYGYGAAVSVIAALILGIITALYLMLSKKLDEIY